MILIVLLTTIIGALVGQPMIGLGVGLALAAVGVWVNSAP